MFMGGEYLPGIDDLEVEVAMISIKSVTYDVTSVYARRGKHRIHYRVVDEYEGMTLTGRASRTYLKPLTLRELVEFFTNAWPLISVLEINFGCDLDSALEFFRAESQFYPMIDEYCRQRVCNTYYNVEHEASKHN